MRATDGGPWFLRVSRAIPVIRDRRGEGVFGPRTAQSAAQHRPWHNGCADQESCAPGTMGPRDPGLGATRGDGRCGYGPLRENGSPSVVVPWSSVPGGPWWWSAPTGRCGGWAWCGRVLDGAPWRGAAGDGDVGASSVDPRRCRRPANGVPAAPTRTRGCPTRPACPCPGVEGGRRQQLTGADQTAWVRVHEPSRQRCTCPRAAT